MPAPAETADSQSRASETAAPEAEAPVTTQAQRSESAVTHAPESPPSGERTAAAQAESTADPHGEERPGGVDEHADDDQVGAKPLFPDPWPAFGTASFSADEGVHVRVMGPGGDPFAASPPAFALWGQTLAGESCTLLPARVNHQAGTLGGDAERDIVGRVFVRGAHLRELAELPFQRARLRFPGLREFLWHPHRGPVGLTEREERGETIHERVVNVPGARLTFRLQWEGPSALHEQRRERPGEVEVELEQPRDFDGWMSDWVRPLQYLLVFTMREPSRPEAFVAVLELPSEPLWWKPNEPRGTETHEIEFIQQESLLLLPGPRWGYTRLLFSLGELLDETDNVMARWFDNHRRLDTSAEFLFGALNTRLRLEDVLLNLTSAAEGYHREFHDEQPLTDERHKALTAAMLARCATSAERTVYKSAIEHANSPSQRRRLRLLYRRAATAVPQRKDAIERHVTQLIETRNYVVHQDAKHADVREGNELSLLLQRLVMVLQANILLDLGFPADGCGGYLRRSYQGERVLARADKERP